MEFSEFIHTFYVMFVTVFLFAVFRVYVVPFFHWHLVKKHQIAKLRNRTKFFFTSE